MSKKLMKLRYAGQCSVCDVALPAGTRAEYDNARKAVTCLGCVGPPQAASTGPAPRPSSPSRPLAQATQIPPPHVPDRVITTAEFEVEPLDVGTAGASARKEHQRRQQKREQQLEEKWGTGFFGHVAKTLSDDPQSTTAWKTGAEGEERLAALLSQ